MSNYQGMVKSVSFIFKKIISSSTGSVHVRMEGLVLQQPCCAYRYITLEDESDRSDGRLET